MSYPKPNEEQHNTLHVGLPPHANPAAASPDADRPQSRDGNHHAAEPTEDIIMRYLRTPRRPASALAALATAVAVTITVTAAAGAAGTGSGSVT